MLSTSPYRTLPCTLNVVCTPFSTQRWSFPSCLIVYTLHSMLHTGWCIRDIFWLYVLARICPLADSSTRNQYRSASFLSGPSSVTGSPLHLRVWNLESQNLRLGPDTLERVLASFPLRFLGHASAPPLVSELPLLLAKRKAAPSCWENGVDVNRTRARLTCLSLRDSLPKPMFPLSSRYFNGTSFP